jgi:hypothetical protein
MCCSEGFDEGGGAEVVQEYRWLRQERRPDYSVHRIYGVGMDKLAVDKSFAFRVPRTRLQAARNPVPDLRRAERAADVLGCLFLAHGFEDRALDLRGLGGESEMV